MTFCCSQCSFVAQFESALTMHHQLHHEQNPQDATPTNLLKNILENKVKPKSRDGSPTSIYSRKSRGFKLGSRTSSATRLLGKLRARICRTKTLCTHAEDPLNMMLNADLSSRSECTSKAMKIDTPSYVSGMSPVKETRETYACHLCSFEADRITVLDRHLLNDHKIGLDNLLKLVLAKTKNSLSEESPTDFFGSRQPYYKPIDQLDDSVQLLFQSPETTQEGEFVIETTAPKIKILRHTATNTELRLNDIPDLKDSCKKITHELDRLIKYPPDKEERNTVLEKMQILNEYMCKFAESSNTLKKVLSKDGKRSSRKEKILDSSLFDLRLEDQNTTRSPRAWGSWGRAHSDKTERYKSKHSHKYRPLHWSLRSILAANDSRGFLGKAKRGSSLFHTNSPIIIIPHNIPSLLSKKLLNAQK